MEERKNDVEKASSAYKLMVFWHKLQNMIPIVKIFIRSDLYWMVRYFVEKILQTRDGSKTYFEQNITRVENIKSKLADEKSRLIYDRMIKYRSTHNPKYTKGIVEKNQYFDKGLIKFGDKEIFVDCGAYNGDTIRSFLKNLREGGGKFKEIIGLEPDPYNYKEVSNWIASLPTGSSERIKAINIGSWNEKETLSFEAGSGGSSRVEKLPKNLTDAEPEKVTINVDTLDDVLGDTAVTFIKMDIEGSELPSLKGAEKVISENHPRLTICIYHSDSDMLEIPEYLMEKFPEYSFYIRHHSQGAGETVLYAIPDKIPGV